MYGQGDGDGWHDDDGLPRTGCVGVGYGRYEVEGDAMIDDDGRDGKRRGVIGALRSAGSAMS